MNIVNENINKYLYGPSEKEIEKRLESSDLDHEELLILSAKAGYLRGVKKATERALNAESEELAFGTVEYYEAALMAAEEGHLDVIKYIKKLDDDISVLDDADYDNILIIAAKNGQLDIVKYLVESGANMHADDNEALRWAMTFNHTDVVNYLENKISEEYEKNS